MDDRKAGSGQRDSRDRQSEIVTTTWRTQQAEGQGEEGADGHQWGDTQGGQRGMGRHPVVLLELLAGGVGWQEKGHI